MLIELLHDKQFRPGTWYVFNKCKLLDRHYIMFIVTRAVHIGVFIGKHFLLFLAD